MQNVYNLICEKVDSAKVLLNEPMYKHTSFKIGGNAEIFVNADSIEDIKYVLQIAKENNIPLFVIGNGSNILVKDSGIKGIVLKPDLTHINVDDLEITVGSGVLLTKLTKEAEKNCLNGLEWACGIPGTIGGAIKMNAGAYGAEIKNVLLSTKYIDLDGNIYTIKNGEHDFSYRHSVFSCNDCIILEATFKLEKSTCEDIEKKTRQYCRLRKENQPKEPSAGSTFKRGENYITAKLIDECGLKGYTIGGAKVSEKHAGFIVNFNKATAEDVINLIEYVKKKVYEKFNINIELEIQMMGE